LQSSIIIEGDIVAQGTSININGNHLSISGNFHISGTNGRLIMQNEADLVEVAGDMTFAGAASRSSSGIDYLNNGVLKVGGDFTQIGSTLPTSSYNYDYADNKFSFHADGAHKVVLNGNSLQTVHFDYPVSGYSQFQNLEIDNSSVEGVLLLTKVYIKQDMMLTNSNINLNGNVLTINRNLYQHDGNILLNGGQLIVNGEHIQTFEDLDSDGLPDYWELQNFGDRTTSDGSTDSDSDGLTDLEEFQQSTNPKLSDTDNDGMPDGWEVNNGLDPLTNDANEDKDGDGYTNLQEYLSSTDPDNNLAVPIPPVADAGPDQLVGENIVVTLSAANSFDLDDGIGSYLWQQVYGDTVNLFDASAIQPHFTSSAGLDPAGISLKFRLTVTDNGGLQTTDTCIVNVSWSNEPPVSSTGQDQDALQDETVSLNGSNSTDLEGEISYLWQQISGSPVSLDDSAIISPTLTTPSDLTAGESLIFELTVSDLDGLQATDSSIVNVTWDNEVPQSVAGPNQMVEPAAMVTLDGSSSHDPDGSIDLYRWKQTQGTPAILSDPTSSTPTFTVPDTCTDGNTMVFELWITDDYGLISRDQCLITIDALPADLNEDGDSDGSDLVDFIHQLSSGDAAMILENFAATFGR
jgi:hypothetical protein